MEPVAHACSPLLQRIRESVIGDDQVMVGPFGARRVTYADYTASGRALTFIEDFIRREVLPRYANTHTESSGTGLQTTRLREDARAIIGRAVGGDDECAVIFAGSGSTGAISKIIGILGLRIPSTLEDRHKLSSHIPEHERPVVFIGPFEHHSNELPWRESIADVVVVPEDTDGHINTLFLTQALTQYADRPLKIGSFSAASNVTGIMSDVRAVSAILHQHGALAFWDYAAAGPYVELSMAGIDAMFLSPHKFIGGPSTPGVLVARRHLLTNRVPEVPGGGTVAYVNATVHRYLDNPVHREEAGTPAIVDSIRAGLVFGLKQSVGIDVIRAHEEDFLRRAVAAWSSEPGLRLLGNLDAERLSILSFVVTAPSGRQLHPNFVVTLLNDLFGIQSRGGCSCAGPYGHRLLGIDEAASHRIDEVLHAGCEGIRPGWVRVNFNYFISEATFGYIVDAVRLVARHGWRMLGFYRFDAATGLWHHRDGLVEPPLRLTDVGYDESGVMQHPRHDDRLPESALADHLREAEQIMAAADPPSDSTDHGLGPAFEDLRWFELPAGCVE